MARHFGRYANTYGAKNSTRKRSYTAKRTRTAGKRARPSYKKKRRTFKGRKRGKVANLSYRVAKLSKSVDAALGDLTHRRLDGGRLQSVVNGSKTQFIDVNTTALNEASLTAVRVYDTTTNGILTKDFSANAFQRDILIKNVSMVATFANNYQTGCLLRVRVMVPVDDTSVTPQAAFTQGLVDVGGPSAVSAIVRFSDSDLLTQLWRSVESKEVWLQAGENCEIKHSLGSYAYDPSVTDSDSLVYRKQDHACAIFIQVRGEMGHDSIETDETSFLEGAVDWRVKIVRKIEYAAGANIKSIVLDNNLDGSFTNEGRVQNMPAAASQDFGR